MFLLTNLSYALPCRVNSQGVLQQDGSWKKSGNCFGRVAKSFSNFLNGEKYTTIKLHGRSKWNWGIGLSLNSKDAGLLSIVLLPPSETDNVPIEWYTAIKLAGLGKCFSVYSFGEITQQSNFFFGCQKMLGPLCDEQFCVLERRMRLWQMLHWRMIVSPSEADTKMCQESLSHNLVAKQFCVRKN